MAWVRKLVAGYQPLTVRYQGYGCHYPSTYARRPMFYGFRGVVKFNLNMEGDSRAEGESGQDVTQRLCHTAQI